MQRYILNRLWQAVVCIVLASILVFTLARVSGDPVAVMLPFEASNEEIAALRTRLGLDKPVYVQYWMWASDALHGDLGVSYRWNRPVTELILDRLPNTIQLALVALAMSVGIGVIVGALSAVRPNGLMDRFGKLFAVAGQSMPTFWVGIMMILLFAVTLHWLPTSGMGGPENMVMPAFALGWLSMASMARMTRSAMLDVLDREYIKMLRIKGTPENLVLWQHALKNAAIPLVTLLALQLAIMFSGSVIIETIFSWPGLGRLVVDAVNQRDFPVLQAAVLVTSSIVVVANLLADVLYGYLDPRIRLR